MITIDILELVDRLEALLNGGWRVPFTVKTVVDESGFFDIIDQLRVSIPQEMQQAKELLQNRERISAAAAEDAQHIVEEARGKAARLLDEHEIVAAARSEAQSIKAQAQLEAEGVRKGADDYAMSILSELETRLASLLRTASNGLASLKRRREKMVSDNLEEGP